VTGVGERRLTKGNARAGGTASGGASVLLCDEERELAELLAGELEDLGHDVTIVCSCSDAFSAACAHDYDVLVAAPFLRDGATLLLPRALGIRRPRLMVLMTRLTERLSAGAAERVGFDAQLTRCVDAGRLDRLMRRAAAAVAVAGSGHAASDDAPPTSEVGARVPR
jgi:DNA-binding NtrC family response regulator